MTRQTEIARMWAKRHPHEQKILAQLKEHAPYWAKRIKKALKDKDLKPLVRHAPTLTSAKKCVVGEVHNYDGDYNRITNKWCLDCADAGYGIYKSARENDISGIIAYIEEFLLHIPDCSTLNRCHK